MAAHIHARARTLPSKLSPLLLLLLLLPLLAEVAAATAATATATAGMPGQHVGRVDQVPCAARMEAQAQAHQVKAKERQVPAGMF